MSGARHKEKDIFGLFGNLAGKAIKSTRPEPTYEMSDSPVIGYVLLREVVSREQIIAALNEQIHDEDTVAWDGLGGGYSAFLQAALARLAGRGGGRGAVAGHLPLPSAVHRWE